MNNFLFSIKLIIVGIFSLSLLLLSTSFSQATTIVELSGYFLLGDQTHADVWYVNPTDQTSYYLGNLESVFFELPTYAIGISNENLSKIPVSGSGELGDAAFKESMAGKLLLQVEASGELWYVSPTTYERFFLANAEMTKSTILSKGVYTSVLDEDQTIQSPSSIPIVEELVDQDQEPLEDIPDTENGGINLFISLYDQSGTNNVGYGEMAYDQSTYALMVLFPDIDLSSDTLSVYRGWVINEATGAYVYTGELTYDSGYWINDYTSDVDLSAYRRYVLTKDPVLTIAPTNTIFEGQFTSL